MKIGDTFGLGVSFLQVMLLLSIVVNEVDKCVRSKEGKDINKSEKAIVSAEALYKLNVGFREQLFGK